MRAAAAALLIILAAAAGTQHRAQTKPQGGARPQPKAGGGEELGDGDVLRVTTELVSVPVSVMDRKGRYVFDLRREDFRVFEDGVEQEISHFSDVEQPFSVLLLMDSSSSTVPYLSQIKDAANAFITQLRPADSVLPLTFDGTLHPLRYSMTRDRKALGGALEKMRSDEAGNGTRLYDAVDFAYRTLKRVRGRKAVLLFTDGEDTWSRATAKDTLYDATELDALVYVIHYGPPPPTDYLSSLAEKTGGRFYQATELETIKQFFSDVAEELRHQYSLGYYPRKSSRRGAERRIKVKVNRPDLGVKTRKSYVY